MTPRNPSPTFHVDSIPTRKNLRRFQQSYLKKARTWFTPDVILLTAPDQSRTVLKDWKGRPWPIRHTWCRFVLAREVAVYRSLAGVNGVPHLINRLDAFGFVMEWLDAESMPRRRYRDRLGPAFFDQLEEIVTGIHSHGVAHGDIRRRNILQGADGSPKLIDFETAVRTGRNQPGRIFRTVETIDKITVLKIKGRYYPELLNDSDRKILEDLPWHLRVGRFFRKRIYGPISPKRIRKRRNAKIKRMESGSHHRPE